MGIRDYLIIFLLALVLLAILTGCAGAQTPPEPLATEGLTYLPTSQPTSTPFIETSDIPAPKPNQTLPVELGPIEPPNLQPVVGEIPEKLLEEIIADLVQRSGTSREDIQVVKAEAIVWNDGSLGCPKPGEFYIQILVSGYWIVMQVKGVEYDYRASDNGHFILCERNGELPPVPPSSAPSN